MKINKPLIFAVLAIFCLNTLSAQKEETNTRREKEKERKQLKRMNDTIKGQWSFGAGINYIDDGGKLLGVLSDANKYGHFSMPFTVNAEYFYSSAFSFTGTLSLNKYVEGKEVDRRGTILKDEEPTYLAFDLGAKLYFRDIMDSYTFDPYLFSGLGYTNLGGHTIIAQGYEIPEGVTIATDGKWEVPAIGYLTFNFGVGANIWLSQHWGLNLNAVSKFAIKPKKYEDIVTNQLQFSLGAFYYLKK